MSVQMRREALVRKAGFAMLRLIHGNGPPLDTHWTRGPTPWLCRLAA